MFTDIIWDFDGTLFNTYPSMVRAFKMALKDSGVNEDEEIILEYMKVSVSNAVNHFKQICNIDDDLAERFNRYEKDTEPNMVTPFPYAGEICREFAESGGRNYILTHRGNSTHKYLKFYGMDRYFTEVFTKHSGFKRKPDPEGFLYIVEKYKLDKEKVLIVGDRDCEIAGAKNSGLKVCLYNTNNINCIDQPNYVIDSLYELKNIL
jgi:haloacid dehalogenase superfamily, subfamily IA, variant 1 with third motif having Dx(3-4)D or Dx(3-4)E